MQDDYKLDKLLSDLAISDILTARFEKVVKDKQINVDEYAKGLGTWWYVPIWDRKTYSDGTFDPVPMNRLKLFLEYKSLYLPPKNELRILESRLGYGLDKICTNHQEGLTAEKFLFGCGYLDQAGRPTRKFNNSPRITAYREFKATEAKDLKKRVDASNKEQAKLKKQKQKNLFSKIKNAALGQWAEL